MLDILTEGSFGIQLGADLEGEEWPGGDWFTDCMISDLSKEIAHSYCWNTKLQNEDFVYTTEDVVVEYGTWHKVRIEVDPATMTFTYYIDDQMVGSQTIDYAEKILSINHFIVHVYRAEDEISEQVTGYADDVQIGQLE
jgi:hypothetical protein